MKTFKLFALCSALAIAACNSKDPKIAQKGGAEAWGLSEPKIISADGLEVKYGEANQKANLTFSIDDRLVMTGTSPNSGVVLNYRTSCLRGGERFHVTANQVLKREYTVFSFMPTELFYSPDGRPLNEVVCTLEITAVNSHGSRHTFPALNLPMVDGGSAKLDLYLSAKKVSVEKVDSLFYDQLEDIELPTITNEEKLTLYCASFVKESPDKYVRNISDLKVVKGQVRGDENRAQLCRLIKTQNNLPIAISPFVKVQFFNSVGLIENTYLPDLDPKSGSLEKGIEYLAYTLKNSNSEPVHMIWPSAIPSTMTLPTWKGTEKIQFGLVPVVEGAEYKIEKGNMHLRIPARSMAVLKFVTPGVFKCIKMVGASRFDVDFQSMDDLMVFVTDGSYQDVLSELSVKLISPRKVYNTVYNIGNSAAPIDQTIRSGICHLR